MGRERRNGKEKECKGKGGSGRGKQSKERGGRGRLRYLSSAPEFLVTPLDDSPDQVVSYATQYMVHWVPWP